MLQSSAASPASGGRGHRTKSRAEAGAKKIEECVIFPEPINEFLAIEHRNGGGLVEIKDYLLHGTGSENPDQWFAAAKCSLIAHTKKR